MTLSGFILSLILSIRPHSYNLIRQPKVDTFSYEEKGVSGFEGALRLLAEEGVGYFNVHSKAPLVPAFSSPKAVHSRSASVRILSWICLVSVVEVVALWISQVHSQSSFLAQEKRIKGVRSKE